MRHECKCGGTIPAGRWDIGFELCLECGDWVASQKKWTVVNGHKSSFFVVSDLQDLKGLNPKRSEI